MPTRLTTGVAKRPGSVVAAFLIAVVVAGYTGRGLFGRLSFANTLDPTSESTRGAQLARREFGEADPDVIALYRLPDGMAVDRGVRDPAICDALGRTLERLSHD